MNSITNISTGTLARQAIRSGSWSKHTVGLAKGYVQGNLVILPQALAADFLLFCQRNPRALSFVGGG